MKTSRRSLALAAPWALLGWAAGCAGPGPRMFPVAPVTERPTSEGGTVRQYALRGGGRPDFEETLSPDGRVVLLRYDLERPDDPKGLVSRLQPTRDGRQLIIIVDSVPYGLVRDLYAQGRFRMFHPPARLIAPFPVMTDLSLAEFFGVSPCAGVDSEFFDGRELTSGFSTYTTERNTPWHRFASYYLATPAHAFAYLYPDAWFDRELRSIQDQFDASREPTALPDPAFVGYCVGPSAIGAKLGRSGHAAALVRLDRMCQQMVFDARGNIQITLLSDHGHNLVRSRLIDLRGYLSRCGYRVHHRLEEVGDVVVPEFSVVTCAGVYTANPARVAADVIQMEGVQLAAYRDGHDAVMVLDPRGAARISRHGASYRYQPLRGDPLELAATMESLRESHRLTPDGCVADAVLFEATCEAVYPDAVHRLWRAFHGLMEHPPDVLLSIGDGYHAGSPFMTEVIQLAAAHGNLAPLSSYGFVMSTVGGLPPISRMESLRLELRRMGVSVPGPEDAATTRPSENSGGNGLAGTRASGS